MKDVAEAQRKRYERMVERLPGKFFFFGLDKHGVMTYVSRFCQRNFWLFGRRSGWQELAGLRRFVALQRILSLEENERRLFAGEELPPREAIIIGG